MKINVLGLIALIGASTVAGISNKASAAVSNYQQSCEQIYVNGNTLSATCQRVNGTSNRTYLTLRGIENIDGVLKVTSQEQDSNYQLSCNRIYVTNGNILHATCLRRDQTYHRTAIVLNGIENIDGVLRYTSNP